MYPNHPPPSPPPLSFTIDCITAILYDLLQFTRPPTTTALVNVSTVAILCFGFLGRSFVQKEAARTPDVIVAPPAYLPLFLLSFLSCFTDPLI